MSLRAIANQVGLSTETVRTMSNAVPSLAALRAES
jgi:hypothetical protein